ncbi:FAD/NAD(P)-binding protein [Amycolatopsis minnesotensis]|uniref:FAD-dependent urate hydroxylase HpyO/Asp monooxygenase CreE-like FAD/NAD(P)-binding domain-containing protein n=1 Tax=Amycolatopsis minnesotensis TaxID=337894 RepID=A0ABN2RK82_9PSEU
MNPADIHGYVMAAAASGELVVQPRMGMGEPGQMAEGLRAVAAADARTVGTITLDSYTRVGDHEGARRALLDGERLNGFPLVAHGAELTRQVVAAVRGRVPVQVRHGCADPERIFEAMVEAGLSISEGGPVSYCLPYSRTPLAEAVRAWSRASDRLVADAGARGMRPHLETFGGCLFGQLCPPSLLIAASVLEAMFFVQHGVRSVSLSYAQQTNATQDIEAVAALRHLAGELLAVDVDRHLVLYTYMGVFPRTEAGASRILDRSAEIAVRGGAERLIVKTAAEAHRIPTVAENVSALVRSARVAERDSDLPRADQVDYGTVLGEARALIEAVLERGDDIGEGLVRSFADGTLDVPYCIHEDNHGQAQGGIGEDGRLYWARTGKMPLPAASRASGRISSGQLLRMLRFTAESYDVGPGYTVAVVGSGPRGLAVLERLAVRLAERPPGGPVLLCLLDSAAVGTGRVWRTDQPVWSLMNTVAGEVTMFSGPADEGMPRAGAGPTLAQWWQRTDPEYPGPDSFAPRPTYGRYLEFALDAIEASLPERVRLRRIRSEVRGMVKSADAYTLTLAHGEQVRADRVVLATGHVPPELAGPRRRLADFAATRPNLAYLHGNSSTDMPLDAIAPGADVGVIGLGLSFYDVMVSLSIGRGGRFAGDGHGLRYLPSGREPRLIAGSRGGVPMPARGRNQKGAEHSYSPRVFTMELVSSLRSKGKLDFRSQLLPWLLAEAELVYYRTALTARFGADVAARFGRHAVEAIEQAGRPHPVLHQVAGRFGLGCLPRLDLESMARPFAGREFAGRAEFDGAVTEALREDLRQAELGNVDGPLKAALDVFRDVRGVLRAAVDFGGLTARSHEEDFLGWFCPIMSLLTVGPPRLRSRQALALMEAGLLRVIGPDARFDVDPAQGRFAVSSPRVRGAKVAVDVLVDARVPGPDLRRDRSPLISGLREAGLLTSFVNEGRFETGGVAVSESPFHPIGRDGQADTGMHVLGIPTEYTRWFTQVGSGRPGRWSEFTRDADAIAAHLVPAVRPAGADTR